MAGGVESLCTDFRCTGIPASKVGEVIGWGIPFVFTLILSRYLLTRNQFRLDRSGFVLQWELSALTRNPFAYEKNAPFLVKFLKLVTLLPLLTGALWSVMVWLALHDYYAYARLPVAVALALAALCLVICMGSYGFLHWQASHFRMTLTTGVCFSVVVAVVVALQLGFTLFVIDTPKSAYIVFMSFNLAPIMLIAYLHEVIAPPITFQQLLRLQGRDPAFEQECARIKVLLNRVIFFLLCLSMLALFLFGLTMQTLFDSPFGWQIGIAVLFCDMSCFLHSTSGVASDPLLLHALSLIGRAVLFASWDTHWFVGVSANFLLFVSFFVYHVVDRRHPLFSKEDALDSVVGSIESAMDEKRQADQAERVKAHKEMREEEEKAAGKKGKVGDELAARVDQVALAVRDHIPGARFVASGAGALGRGAKDLAEQLEAKTASLFRSSEFALFLLCTLYALYVAVAIYADAKDPSWGPNLFPPIVMASGVAHAQYQVGLLTALVVVCATLFFLGFRLYEINSFNWSFRVGLAGAAFLAVSIASSIGVSVLTHSNQIYVYGIYFPLIAVMSTLTYCAWRKQDYRWNGWQNYQEGVWRQMVKSAKAAQAAEEEAAQAQANSAGEDKSDQSKMERMSVDQEASWASPSSGHGNKFPAFAAKLKLNLTLRTEYSCPHNWSMDGPAKDPKFLYYLVKDLLSFNHTAADYIILCSVSFLVVLLVAFGNHLAGYENRETSFFAASMTSMLIFTVFVLLKWFNTFTVGWIQVLVLTGLLLHCSVTLFTAYGDTVESPIALALLYPAVMLTVMAMYSWRANNWKLSLLIKRLMFVACFLVLAYLLAFIALTHLYEEGILALIVYSVAVYFLVLVMVWSSEDFHLPRSYFISAIVVSSVMILIALVIIVILNKTWFQMFTVLWIFAQIALVAYTIQETQTSDARKLLPSKYIFPVYEYQPKLNGIEIKVRNNGVISLILVAALSMMWGFIAALLIKPDYVGWIFFCLGGLMFFVIAMEALFKPIIAFWSNFSLVQDAPALIDHARETALKSQLGSSEGAFAEEGGEELDESAEEGGAVTASGPEDSLKTLKRLQQYWSHEEASEVESLEKERRAFLAHPHVPEDADVSERARFIASQLHEFDRRIAKVFEEQTRILVMFQLLVNVGAQALLKKNRARVKDFLRKYFARKQEVAHALAHNQEPPKRRRTGTTSNAPGQSAAAPDADADDDDDLNDTYPLIDLASSSAVEIQEWARGNEELKRRAFRYVQELQESGQEAKKKQEEQAAAAVERKKAAAAAAPPVNIAVIPAVAAPGSAAAAAAAASYSLTPNPLHAAPSSPSASSSPSPAAPGPVVSPRTQMLHRGDPSKVVRDDYLYRQRGVSIDVASLNITGPTAESVVSKARIAVAEIIQRHGAVSRANKASGVDSSAAAFADPFFPPVADLDSLIDAGTDPSDKGAAAAGKPKKRKACWKRLGEISASPAIFAAGKLDPALIVQGDLEDCYLLSALSVIARTPQRIKDLFLVSEVNEYGIYGMTFFVDGEWRAIFVDDQFPFLGSKLAFARSKNPNEFWVPILEKCYAKLYAGYPSIIGGLVHASFKDLTGGITDEVALDSADSGAFDGRLWQRLFAYFKEGYLMGCGNPKPHAGNFTVVSGIVQGHAYAILDLREVGDLKLIQLRNPWGEGEWEGDWGDGSDKWTQKMRTLCDYPESTDSDGIFYMSFEDFAVNFQRVYICRVFDNLLDLNPDGSAAAKAPVVKAAPAVNPWHRVSLRSEWKGASAVGHVCHLKKFPDRKPELNPQFTLKLTGSRPGIVFLTLTQPTQTGGGQYFFLSLLVLKKNGMRAHDVKKSELVAGNTKCRNSREICAEVNLEPGVTYTVFCATYEPKQECAFTLAAYCRYPVALQAMSETSGVS